VSFLPGPYPNGRWEIESDGWRFYHDPCTVSQTSGGHLRKYLMGYPGGPDWSFCLPEPFVRCWEMRDESSDAHELWQMCAAGLEKTGWQAVKALLQPKLGWPERAVESLDYWTCRLLHDAWYGRAAAGCQWCDSTVKHLEWAREVNRKAGITP